MTHAVPLAVIVVYIVVMFAVTWWSSRVTHEADGGIVGYLLAGREMPAWVTAAMLTGLAVGGASTIGVAEQAYTVGFSAGWYNAAWAFGAFVMGLGAARRYRRSAITTLPELFERHYGVTARVVGVVGQLVIQVVITSLQYVAGRRDPVLAGAGGVLVPGGHGGHGRSSSSGSRSSGGFWAAGLTNVVNVVVIYVGVILGAVLTVHRVGGFAASPHGCPRGTLASTSWRSVRD